MNFREVSWDRTFTTRKAWHILTLGCRVYKNERLIDEIIPSETFVFRQYPATEAVSTYRLQPFGETHASVHGPQDIGEVEDRLGAPLRPEESVIPFFVTCPVLGASVDTVRNSKYVRMRRTEPPPMGYRQWETSPPGIAEAVHLPGVQTSAFKCTVDKDFPWHVMNMAFDYSVGPDARIILIFTTPNPVINVVFQLSPTSDNVMLGVRLFDEDLFQGGGAYSGVTQTSGSVWIASSSHAKPDYMVGVWGGR